jgi:ABC-type glycerol-3-phosphate transport system permease component
MIMAGSVIVMIPCLLVFFFAQKYFIQGIVFTGIK